jgi:hypothetical protein
MPAALEYTYCTRTQVERLLSTLGVAERLDHNADGVVEASEALLMDDAIAMATETCNFYLYGKYAPARLSQSNLVNRWATAFAALELCLTRGGVVPEALQERVEKYQEWLELVAEGKRFLPNVPLRRNQAPIYDNIRCDPRYQWRVIRVEKRTSSQEPTDRPVRPDYRELYSWEI